MTADLVVATPRGLYCPPGDFYIDPSRTVSHAVITHAHADHARRGHGHYLACAEGEAVLRARLGAITLDTLAYGESIVHRGVHISLHPAGHVLGSAQVRLEHGGQVWVVSGDYYLSASCDHNPTCPPFEPVRCDCFITESTFGLPLYQWPTQADVFKAINAWWLANAAAGAVSVLWGYSLGKAQHLLAGVDASLGPVFVHRAVQAMNAAYLASGVALPQTRPLEQADASTLRGALVLAPPQSELGPAFAGLDVHTAFASGWMQLRGQRQARGAGFVLSDHADWPGLLRAVAASSAPRVIVTHGAQAALCRYLGDQGRQVEFFNRAGEAAGDNSAPARTPGLPA